MNVTNINGVVLNERISENLVKLQDGYASVLASGLNDVIGFLLENRVSFDGDSKEILNVLETLYYARTELMALVPQKEDGSIR